MPAALSRDLTRPDVRAAADLLADAFEGAAVARGIFPSDAARRPVLAATFATTLTEALARGARLRLVEDADGPLGVAVCLTPATAPAQPWRVAPAVPILLRRLGLRGVLAAQRDQDAVNAAMHAALPSQDHVYLTLLAVADRARGRALARTLIEDALAHADAHGLPVHLECEPHLAGLYESFGFARTGTLEHALGNGVAQLTMLRPANGGR